MSAVPFLLRGAIGALSVGGSSSVETLSHAGAVEVVGKTLAEVAGVVGVGDCEVVVVEVGDVGREGEGKGRIGESGTEGSPCL